MKDQPIKLSRVIAICLIVAVVTAGIVRATSPTQPFTINRGVYPGAASFTIWEESGTYFAKNVYGVIADSGTDVANVINSILDNDISIYFASGTYIFEDTVFLSSKTNVVFSGSSAILQKDANFMGHISDYAYSMFAGNYSTVEFHNLIFDGSNAPYSEQCTLVFKYSEVTCKNCKFSNEVYKTIAFQSCNLTVTDCFFHDTLQPLYMSGEGGSCRVFNTKFLNITEQALYGNEGEIALFDNCIFDTVGGTSNVDIRSALKHALIQNCVFHDGYFTLTYYAIGISAVTDPSGSRIVTGNTFYNFDTSYISFSGLNVKITDNIFTCSPSFTAEYKYAIRNNYYSTCSNFVISNNQICNFTTTGCKGIYLDSSTSSGVMNGTISYNVIRDVNYRGIELENAERITINGNVIDAIASANGIRENSNCDYNIIGGNICNGVLILISGANTHSYANWNSSSWVVTS